MEGHTFVTSSTLHIVRKPSFSCSRLQKVPCRRNATTVATKARKFLVLRATQTFRKMSNSVLELFRQKDTTQQQSSNIHIPHLFVGQLKPLETDSKVNLSMLGIFASCVIIFSSVLKKVLNKNPSQPKNLSDTNLTTVRNEQDQQTLRQLENISCALANLKNAINDDTEHASELFLKFLQEASVQELQNSQPVTSVSLERIITDILKEFDKKLRYYHSTFTILEKFSQHAVNELESNLKETSKDNNLFKEIAQNITNVSYTEMNTMPRSVSELYEQLRSNDKIAIVNQKCEKVSLDITRMKRTLQFTLAKLQTLGMMSTHSDAAGEKNLALFGGAQREIEPQEWLQFLETKTDISKLSPLQHELENIPKDQQWIFLSSTLEKVSSGLSCDDFLTDSESKRLIREKDEEIAFLRQRLQEMEQEKTKTKKVRSRASKNNTNSTQAVDSTTVNSKRTRSKKKTLVSENDGNAA